MLSEDRLSTASNHSQYHDHHDRTEDESKAVARYVSPPPPVIDLSLTTCSELLTNETAVFDVEPPSPLENVIKDILAGSDQLYPSLPPSDTNYNEDTDEEQYHTISDDSDSSADTRLPRRRDSIMASEQAKVPDISSTKQDAGDQKSPAIQKVLSTYELLEHILLDLAATTDSRSSRKDMQGLKTTLLAERVNKTFRYVTKRSAKLQEILFFKYNAGKDRDFDDIAWNPFLLLHPACTTGWGRIQSIHRDGFIRIEPREPDIGNIFSLPSSYHGAGSGHRQQSWRRMLVCQGEPLDMQLNVNPFAPDREAWWCPQLVVGTKATMGQVWDKVLVEKEWKLQ